MNTTSMRQQLSTNILGDLSSVVQSKKYVCFKFVSDQVQFEWSASVCVITHCPTCSEHGVMRSVRVGNKVYTKKTNIIVQSIKSKVFIDNWITRITEKLSD